MGEEKEKEVGEEAVWSYSSIWIGLHLLVAIWQCVERSHTWDAIYFLLSLLSFDSVSNSPWLTMGPLLFSVLPLWITQESQIPIFGGVHVGDGEMQTLLKLCFPGVPQ